MYIYIYIYKYTYIYIYIIHITSVVQYHVRFQQHVWQAFSELCAALRGAKSRRAALRASGAPICGCLVANMFAHLFVFANWLEYMAAETFSIEIGRYVHSKYILKYI